MKGVQMQLLSAFSSKTDTESPKFYKAPSEPEPLKPDRIDNKMKIPMSGLQK